MFTGIIQAVGRVTGVDEQDGDLRLRITADGPAWRDYDLGESIAVNGVCLTAVALHDDGFDTDVSRETMNVTALKGLTVGSRVNLEPSLALGDRLGGHLVTGHVDCVGTVRSRRPDGKSLRLDIAIPREFSRYVARKGSVTVDGVSLTVNAVSEDAFSVNIIPHTADVTIIGDYRPGTEVNIEVDLVARYLERLLSGGDGGTGQDLSKAYGHGR